MSARKFKAIRKLVYGDLSTRLPERPQPWQIVRLDRLKVIYRRAKKSYRNGSCVLLLLGMK